MRFTSRDLSGQYISRSYQDVLQQYINNTGSLLYVLDGYGNVVFGIPSSSLGNTVITSDITSSMTVLSASYSQIIEITQFSSSFASSSVSSLSSDFALLAGYSFLSDSSSYASSSISSSYSLTASYALNAGTSGTTLETGSLYPITSSWSITSSFSNTASYALNAGSSGTTLITGSNYPITSSWALNVATSSYALNSDFSITSGNTLYTASYAISTSFANTVLSDTSSYSYTSSYALNAGSSGTTLVTGSLYPITSSWSQYTETSSYVYGLPSIKSGVISGSEFGMSSFGRFTSSVLFLNPFINDIYSVSICSTNDSIRIWTIMNQSAGGFTIDSGDNVSISGRVMWQAIYVGEYN